VVDLGTFPFGEPVRPVVELDRSPRSVFVLGVHSSAVHARWIGPQGRTRVMALAVANEPYPFRKGEGADEIISGIGASPEAGRLTSAGEQFNGPSGIALEAITGTGYRAIALAHPRQTAGLGTHSKQWREIHQSWKESVAGTLRTELGLNG
jgi:hypothetical protein